MNNPRVGDTLLFTEEEQEKIKKLLSNINTNQLLNIYLVVELDLEAHWSLEEYLTHLINTVPNTPKPFIILALVAMQRRLGFYVHPELLVAVSTPFWENVIESVQASFKHGFFYEGIAFLVEQVEKKFNYNLK